MAGPEWSVATLEPFDWAAPALPPELAYDVTRPDLGDVYEPSHVLHYAHEVLKWVERGGTASEIAVIVLEALSKHGKLLVWLEGGAIVGHIGTMVSVSLQVYEAFDTPLRIEHQKGISYGVMWGVMGVPDVERTTRPGPTEDVQIPMSDGERAAWEEGVREGRELSRDPYVQEAIKLTLAYELAQQQRDPDTDPSGRAWQAAVDRTLDRLWNEVHEDLAPLKGSHLSWPSNDYGDPVRILTRVKED